MNRLYYGNISFATHEKYANTTYILIHDDYEKLRLIGESPNIESSATILPFPKSLIFVIAFRFNKNDNLVYYSLFNYYNLNHRSILNKLSTIESFNFLTSSFDLETKYAFKTTNNFKFITNSYCKQAKKFPSWLNEDFEYYTDIFFKNTENIIKIFNK